MRIILTAVLLVACCTSLANAQDCTQDKGRILAGAEDIRRAVKADETIVINSKGTHAVCGATQAPTATQPAPPPPEPNLTIPFAQQSAAVPETLEPDLQRVVQRAQAIGARLRIAATAYAENLSHATRLAHARAEAVRSLLVSFGIKNDAIDLKVRGGSEGLDHVELDLVVSARGPPRHA